MITVINKPLHGKTYSIYRNLGIQTYRIAYKHNKKGDATYTTLNLESFWEFMGNKNYQLIELGYHYQLYIKEY
jgi:hypothetical protein